MRKIKLLIFLLLLPYFLYATTVKELRLKNGLTLLFYEKSNAPVVDVRLFYDVGSYIEKDGQKGLSHLFEHMMFRGSENYGDEEHSQLIQAVGGTVNAYTTDDMTVYYQKLPADQLELVLELEADRMENLIINESILEKEKEVVKEEYRWRYQNNPQGKMFMEARKLLFPSHNYELGAIGTLEDVSAANVDDCKAFHKKYYAPNNAVLVIVGDLNYRQVKRLVKKHFSTIAYQEIIKPETEILPAYEAYQEYAVVTEFPTLISTFSFVLPRAGTELKDKIALDMISFALASGDTSRLYKKVVTDEGLGVSVFEYIIDNKLGALLMIGISHQSQELDKIKYSFWQSLDSIKANGLSEREFEKIKNRFLYLSRIEQFSASSLADQIGRSYLYTGKKDSYFEQFKRLESISNEDIIEVANRYLNKSQARYILFKPEEKL